MFARATAMATQAGVSSLEGAELARVALRLFRAGRRELGSDSLTAAVHLFGWALQCAVAQRLTLEAGQVGLGTDRGVDMLERGGMAQSRAERSWIAAVNAAGLLDGREPATTRSAPWLETDEDEGADS